MEKHFKITGVQNKKYYVTIVSFLFLCISAWAFCGVTDVFADPLSEENNQQTTAAPKEKIDLENKGFFNNPFPRLFFWVLIGISKLIYLAVSTISFSLSDTIMKIFESEGLYTGWVVVRDFFNIFFIFFLIFSAFCTIFQVSKYHIRSTWIMIVVMALLVNFSWPLTRVMIDISNVTMVYILNGSGMTEDNAVKSKGLVAKLSQETEFIYLILGGNYVSKDKSTIYRKDGLVSAMLVGIIFGLIFLFTMVAIGILLLIRTILLAVLLVLSPVGFILTAFPSTRSRANQWWSELIDQLYVGPIVLFGLLLAVKVMSSMADEWEASTVSTYGFDQYAEMPKFAVAIIMIWTSIIAARDLSGKAASMSMNGANAMRKWAGKGGKWTAGKAVAGSGYAMDRVSPAMAKSDSKIVRGMGQIYDITRSMPSRAKNMKDNAAKSAQQRREESTARGMNRFNSDWLGGDKNAMRNMTFKNIAAEEEKIKKNNVQFTDSRDAVRAQAKNAADGKDINAAKAQAAIQHMMKDENFGKDMGAHDDIMKLIGAMNHLTDAEKETMRGNVEKKYIEKGKGFEVMQSRIGRAGETGYKNVKEGYEKMFANMNGGDLAKQESLLKHLNETDSIDGGYIRQSMQDRFQNNAQLQQQFLRKAGSGAESEARRAGILGSSTKGTGRKRTNTNSGTSSGSEDTSTSGGGEKTSSQS